MAFWIKIGKIVCFLFIKVISSEVEQLAIKKFFCSFFLSFYLDAKGPKDQDLDFEAKVYSNFLKFLKLTPTPFPSLVQTVEFF